MPVQPLCSSTARTWPGSAKANWPGAPGSPRRERHERRGSLLGRGHERVVLGAAPHDQPQLAPGPCRGTEVGEGFDGVVEEHDAEARDDRVEAGRLEVVALGVGHDEAHRHAFPLGAQAGGGHHRLGDVDARARAPRAEAPARGPRWWHRCRSRRRALDRPRRRRSRRRRARRSSGRNSSSSTSCSSTQLCPASCRSSGPSRRCAAPRVTASGQATGARSGRRCPTDRAPSPGGRRTACRAAPR